MKPPFPYFGGKQRIAEQIVSYFPEHGHYVEPYCGGLSVLMAKAPSPLETVNDLDGDIMAFWRVLRDQPDELERVCALTPHSRAESLLARERDTVDDVERARRVWVALTQRRGGQLRATGWRFNIDPKGTSLSLPKYLSGYIGRFAPAAERLRNVSLENRPALEIIDAYGRFEGTLLYVDPPYLGDTRGSTDAYRFEMKHAPEHTEMLDALRKCSATVIISGYHSDLYRDVIGDWHQVEIDAHTGQANGPAESATRTEVLWSNREIGTTVDSALDFGDWEVTA
ncbi:MAG: adenine methylase [Schumannella sp.]|nr:adenine methylase [Schumannella sp.]